MNKKHILVADDERHFLKTMEFILEAAGYNVSIAHNGMEAFRMISESYSIGAPFDLLITDMKMEGLTGLQLIDKLLESQIQMPVFVITSYGDKSLVVELLRRGCSDYLDKPIDDGELIKRVSMALSKKSKYLKKQRVN